MPGIFKTDRKPSAGTRTGFAGVPAPVPSRLRQLTGFGSNPGALIGWFYAPDPARDVALVVVLHGCTQTAAGYDHGSGWSDLAEQFGFAVLLPEQQRANNPNLCFNWFLENDTRRDQGEVLSIRQMIDAMSTRHAIAPARIFVTGLSAGGAMTTAMLATYPELFAGGSIIAGLPYGAARSVPEALDRMRGTGHTTAAAYAAAVRHASSYVGQWPRVTVWHGDADRTVVEANADATIGQWRSLHETASSPDRIERVDGQQRRIWLGRNGEIAVDEYRIAGLGHGTPLKTQGDDGCGHAGAHMLEAGISSTWRQAESWGLLNGARKSRAVPPDPVVAPLSAEAPAWDGSDMAASVNATIERALRSAGLM